jgi:hypothetical protein
MFNRWVGILSVLGMLLANGALLWREVVPYWLTSSAPSNPASHLGIGERRVNQVGIFMATTNARVGSSWLESRRFENSVTVQSRTMLESLPIPAQTVAPAVVFNTSIRYELREDYRPGRLPIPDEIEMELNGLGFPIRARGEYFTGEFPFEWRVGDQRGRLLFPADSLRSLGDVFRPFDRLPGLYVGRTWSIEVFNPLAGMLPGLAGPGMQSEKIVVRVTGKEDIEHPLTGENVSTFVVDAPQARAWVAADGAVLVQEVELPVIGGLRLVKEPFDQRAFDEAGAYGILDDAYFDESGEEPGSFFDFMQPADQEFDR